MQRPTPVICLSALLLAAVPNPAQAQKKKPASPAAASAARAASPAAKLEGLDDLARQAMKEWKVPGVALAVVQDGKVIYAKGFGYRDLENKLPVTTATLFPIGSITKSFTALTFGILRNEGKVDGLVPVDLTFVSEDAEGESREGFGDRADGKQGCGRDREFGVEVAIAESFGVDDFAVLYDGQGDARDFPFLHCLTSEIIKALELGSGRGRSSRGGSGGRSRFLLLRLRRVGHSREKQCGQAYYRRRSLHRGPFRREANSEFDAQANLTFTARQELCNRAENGFSGIQGRVILI